MRNMRGKRFRGLRMLVFGGAVLIAGWIISGPSGVVQAEQESHQMLRWDQALPAAGRFVVLAAFNNNAVLDKNTGLVWERSPSTTTARWDDITPTGAAHTCIDRIVGGQKGWRLPAIAELMSLVDPSVPSPGPTLPPGHPFLNVQSASYWSSSVVAADPLHVWDVRFNFGDAFTGSPQGSVYVWCVRGPMQQSVY
jgi:hypothetical protein